MMSQCMSAPAWLALIVQFVVFVSGFVCFFLMSVGLLTFVWLILMPVAL